MNIETAQKLIENLGGTEKAKEIIKNCPKECTVYREAIGNIVIKEIPVGVIATALAVLGVDYGQPKYFSITYDMSKLSDDEQKAVIAEASSLFRSQKAVCAGWENDGVTNNGWISVDDALPTQSDQYWVAYRPISNYNLNEKTTEICYCTAHFDSYDKIWSVKDELFYTQRRCKVLFWQPLPKPPKE
ncbi:DUF551 domain-containing protein [Moraxella bovis]|uniref:DUF551 domain-containing protein n=1 Tax=Moraxella bovis TaxID=476 RepID=A0AAX3EX18_MORBO|nr:DUF551 domain-containing protein [Moraxella bovis]AWY19926.1 hypothetical protein DQF64_05080 [Moraxella bovis]AWY20315.1 hypothetical protein DQF64_07295 [Moraxella bovis]UYZ79875.1 DUF551 domain-containing protein [Moraxella bovis]UZA52559.1 DUF551 domain-containing protein [Moraxella bovis]